MPRYVLTTEFRERVHTSALAHHSLAVIGGLANADFNRFLQGTPFGARSRQRVLLIGHQLGLSEGACCQKFHDPIVGGESAS